MGHRAVTLAATNRSSIACSLNGYPGLRLLDSKRRPMETHVSHGPLYFHKQVSPRIVVVKPGKSARAWLEYGAVPVSGTSRSTSQCEPTSAYLRVTPPASKTSGIVKFGDFACGHGSTRDERLLRLEDLTLVGSRQLSFGTSSVSDRI